MPDILDIVKRGKEYHWVFRSDRSYWLGSGNRLFGDRVWWFGAQLNKVGNLVHVFYLVIHGANFADNLMRYEACGTRCWFESDGEDEPSIPYLSCTEAERVKPGVQADYIKGVIAARVSRDKIVKETALKAIGIVDKQH